MRHELGERTRPLEHERVDRDALARTALDLAQRLLDRPARRRVAELDLAVLEVSGRLTVRDDDDLLVRCRLAGEDPPREQQPVLQVRAVLVAVPGQLGEGTRPDLTGVVRESDDRQVIRGYCVRMRVSSATATFFAARKQPRNSIDRLMSTSNTVAVRVSCSDR